MEFVIVLVLALGFGLFLRIFVIQPRMARRRMRREVQDEVNRREYNAYKEELVKDEMQKRQNGLRG